MHRIVRLLFGTAFAAYGGSAGAAGPRGPVTANARLSARIGSASTLLAPLTAPGHPASVELLPVAVKAVAAPITAPGHSVSGELLPVASEASAVYFAPSDTLVDTTGKPDSAREALASLAGRSGKLKAHFLTQARRALEVPIIRRLFGGDSALTEPGVYAVPDNSFAFITMLPFTSKTKGRIGDYRIGFWPSERHRKRASLEAYENPDGFIKVTPENADTPISEHFTLRDFLTHDQQDVWPKYMVLREELVDKLELIIDDMEAHGHPVSRLVVMSGFRTPEYNIQGVGRRGGRALDSRHQFGDAADVYVDNGDGRMADLNGDGRVDTRDVRVLLESAERVEADHPELVGGEGIYRANRQHGPFLHVDVRGWPARWALIEPAHASRRKTRRHVG